MNYRRMIDALEEMYASGILSSSVDGTQVRFDSGDELLKRIAWLKEQQAKKEGQPRRRRGAWPLRLG